MSLYLEPKKSKTKSVAITPLSDDLTVKRPRIESKIIIQPKLKQPSKSTNKVKVGKFNNTETKLMTVEIKKVRKELEEEKKNYMKCIAQAAIDKVRSAREIAELKKELKDSKMKAEIKSTMESPGGSDISRSESNTERSSRC